MSIIGEYVDEIGKVKRNSRDIDLSEKSYSNRTWIPVHVDTEYTLKVMFSRRQISNKVSLFLHFLEWSLRIFLPGKISSKIHT